MTGTTALTDLPEWEALQAHYESVKDLHLRALFASDPGRAERFRVEAAGLFLDYSKNRITDETIRLLVTLPAHAASRRGGTRCSPARRSTSAKTAPSCMWRSGRRADSAYFRRRQGRRARGSRGARPDGGLCRPGAVGRMDRAHRQAHPQRHQRRDRRLVSRAGDGLSRAAAVLRSRPQSPLRRQCRRRRFHQGDRGPRPARDAVHHRVEDLHDAGDDDERGGRAPLGAGRDRRRGGRRAPFRRTFDQRRGGR